VSASFGSGTGLAINSSWRIWRSETTCSAADFPEEMEDIEALEGVKVLPARIKCAVLSWDTLLEGMKDVGEK
jgi:NifU-like protein involved in Fe-S cluster formation